MYSNFKFIQTVLIIDLREAIRLDKASLASAKIEPAFDKIRKLPEYKEIIHVSEPEQ